MSKLSILELLDSGNYRTYNIAVARALGSVNAAIMMSELVNRHCYHRDRNELKTFLKYEGVWFFYTIEKCEERTGLSRKEQDSAIKILESKKIVKKSIIGLPARRHFILNDVEIRGLVEDSNNVYSLSKKGKLGCTKRANWIDPKGQAKEEHYLKKEEEEGEISRGGTFSEKSTPAKLTKKSTAEEKILVLEQPVSSLPCSSRKLTSEEASYVENLGKQKVLDFLPAMNKSDLVQQYGVDLVDLVLISFLKKNLKKGILSKRLRSPVGVLYTECKLLNSQKEVSK